MRLDSTADPVSPPSDADTSSLDGLQRPLSNEDIAAAPSMTSTLALLPSSPLGARRDNVYTPSLSYQRPPLARSQSSPQKPQLSLNTSSCSWRVIGKGNTGLRLEDLSASSPTVQNTYKNGYEAVRALPGTPAVLRERGTPASVTRSSHSAPSTPHPRIDSPASSSTSASVPSLISGSSQSSAVDMDLEGARNGMLFGTDVPYARNPGLHPILSNTPLPSKHVCTPRTAARRHHRRPHSVSFRPALTEEIRTTNYVAKHSDLLEKPSATVKSPRGEKRESPESESQSSSGGESSGESDDQGESCPKTPVAGRRKRRREWVWTLGALEGVPCRTPDTPDPGPGPAVANPNWGNGETALEAPRLAMPTPRRRAT